MMRLSTVLTVIGTVAGVIGAGAAVYPMFVAESHGGLLKFSDVLDDRLGKGRTLSIEPLGETIAVTGEWYIRRLQWWRIGQLRVGKAVELPSSGTRIGPDGRRLAIIDDRGIEEWIRRDITYCSEGEFELGIEYKWRGGTSWAKAILPLCVYVRKAD
jgi:hypothetical protein